MTDGLDAAYAECEALVRAADRDRWLAALFAPADKRRHLLALAAYSVEVARVRAVVHEAMPGEVRLQWWVDAVEGIGHGHVSGHPVAAALLDTAERFSLSRPALSAMADARRFDLYDDPMPSLNDLEGYAGETASALMQLSAAVLCDGGDPRAADASGHAGVALTLIGVMRALPVEARRGQVLLPLDVLARHGADAALVRAARPTPPLSAALAELREHVRHHRDRARVALRGIEPHARPAFVVLGLVDPYLRALERQPDPFGAVVDLPAWRKPLALWLESRRSKR
jgi:phytoene synthase